MCMNVLNDATFDGVGAIHPFIPPLVAFLAKNLARHVEHLACGGSAGDGQGCHCCNY